MSTDQLGPALRDLVDGVEDDALAPDARALWRHGSRRRLRTRAVSGLAAAAVAGLVAVVLWPAGAPRASVPASEPDATGAVHLTSHPGVLAKPPFAASTATPGLTAAVVMEHGDDVELHAVSPTGAVTRLDLPQAVPGTDGISLSPGGRWLARGSEIHDLVRGGSVPGADALRTLERTRVPAERAPWWSPDSRRVFVDAMNQGAPASTGVLLGTDGSVAEAPLAAGDRPVLVAGWLDADTVLAFADVGTTEGNRLEGRTWRVGDPSWVVAGPDLTWVDHGFDTLSDTGIRRVSLSPGATRLLVTMVGTVGDGSQPEHTLAVEFDARTGQQLHPIEQQGTEVTVPVYDVYEWDGSGCRVAWRDELSLATDGDIHPATGGPVNTPVEVSSRYDSPCSVFAGDELRGAAVTGGASVWQERAWTWGWRLLALVAAVALVRWYSRRRAWRQSFRAELPPMPGSLAR